MCDIHIGIKLRFEFASCKDLFRENCFLPKNNNSYSGQLNSKYLIKRGITSSNAPHSGGNKKCY